MRTIDLTSRGRITDADIRDSLPRASFDAGDALQKVIPLINEVKTDGAAALLRHAEFFDGVTGHSLRVSAESIQKAFENADESLIRALEEMIGRVEEASRAQVPKEIETRFAGGTITQRWVPVERVGLYVPGGKAVYPSSVVMNAVPALVAGVKSIAIASPVQKDFKGVHPTILVAAKLLGIDEVYAIGGASAIAAFAYGVEEIGLLPAQIVTGPGNIFVAAAKRALQGVIGIDSEAGTTEIMILADSSANPDFVAADLLSQAEHDEAAASVLVTDSKAFAHDVLAALDLQLKSTEHRERAAKALSGQQSAVMIVNDLQDAVTVSNQYAPEHLSVIVEDPSKILPGLVNAGAIFVGPYTPVSLGDYMAGSNHVLPTGATAKFSSGLGAFTFLRPQQTIEYTASGLNEVLEPLTVLAQAEGLSAHADAAKIRFRG